MKRYQIVHQTNYSFHEPVLLQPHTLRLRPREDHELRIESSILDISPVASVRWQRDVEGNSVATACFTGSTQHLTINSEVIIQQYNQLPYDFLVADYAIHYPIHYNSEDTILLAPYRGTTATSRQWHIEEMVNKIWKPDEPIETFALLLRINQSIFQTIDYRMREEAGVQPAEYTLTCGSGSCRDSAYLFMVIAQHLGFAARFVSGYLFLNAPVARSGSTHAWAEVFIPGAGWKGFDPSTGNVVGSDHIPVAVARSPESVPPVAGSFLGVPGATMEVNVWVTELFQ